MGAYCDKCKEVIVAECGDEEICPIMISDICVKNTIVDANYGLNAEMNIKEVIDILIAKIKNLEQKVNYN